MAFNIGVYEKSRIFSKKRKITKNRPILMLKKGKSKLETALQDAKNRIKFRCVSPELFAIKRVFSLHVYSVFSFISPAFGIVPKFLRR